MASGLARLEFGDRERSAAYALVKLAIAEDQDAEGDLTGQAIVPGGAVGAGRFVAREAGVIAGLPVVAILAAEVGLELEVHSSQGDGAPADPHMPFATLSGPMRELLASERIALNFLMRLSGIATLTRAYVDAVADTHAKILDTRKTTPGLRMLEKYAVRAGGGENHRLGLYDGILIKDNHLAFLASAPDPIGSAIRLARLRAPQGAPVEIEVDRIDQFEQALWHKPDIILLDNFALDLLADAVRVRNLRAPAIALEASGGIRLDTVRAIALTGVDRISVGALTHSAKALDIGLDFDAPAPH